MAMSFNKILEATNFAAEKHRNQRRKNVEKTPYIGHPIEVATLLTRGGVNDESVLIAALLHDTIEDTETTIEEITEKFGEDVAHIVMECTDDKSMDKVSRKKFQIVHAANISVQGKLVKLADKLSNLGDLFRNPPISWTPDIVRGYAYWSFAVCKQMAGTNTFMETKINEELAVCGVNTVDMSDAELESRLNAYYALIEGKD